MADRFIGGGSAAIRGGTGRRGTGYTNMSSLLNANIGYDKKLQEEAGKLGQSLDASGAEKDKEVGGLKWDAKTYGYDQAADLVGKNDQKTLREGMDQKFTGPRESAINLTELQSFADLKKLNDPKAAGAMLADKNQAYTGGMRSFDEALFGASAARGGMLKSIDGATAKEADTDKLFGEKVAGFDKAAENASKGLRDQLTRYHSNLSRGVDDRVAQELAAEKALYNPLKGSDNSMRFVGQTGTANRANQVTQDESDRFGTLSALLGTEGLARDPNYQRAKVEEYFDRPKAERNDEPLMKNSPTGTHLPSEAEAASMKKALEKVKQSGGNVPAARKQIQNVNKAKAKKENMQAGKYRSDI